MLNRRRRRIVTEKQKLLRLLNLTNMAKRRGYTNYYDILNLVKAQPWSPRAKQDTIDSYAQEIAHRLNVPLVVKEISLEAVFQPASALHGQSKAVLDAPSPSSPPTKSSESNLTTP